MKWIVEIRDNLTAYHTFRGDDPGREDEYHKTDEVLETHKFETEAEATEFFKKRKAMLKIAGGAGHYVTHPRLERNW